MEKTAAELTNEVEATKRELQNNLSRIDATLSEKLDIKAQTRKHPFKLVGISVAAGFVVTLLLTRRVPKREMGVLMRAVFEAAAIGASKYLSNKLKDTKTGAPIESNPFEQTSYR